MFGQLILQAVLIAINAVFAASEMAFVSLNENKIKKQAKDADKKAVRIMKLLSSPTGMLSAIQICITLAGFLGSAFAADSFSEIMVRFLVDKAGIDFVSEKVLDSISVVVITVILSYFTLVFGELVPKRIAMKKAEFIAGHIAGILNVLCIILKPVVWFLSCSTDIVLNLIGINPDKKEETPSEEDILMLLDEGSEQGTIDIDQKEMIENVFELDNTSVNNMMVHRRDMTAIKLHSTNEEILSVIRESGFSRVPVIGENSDDIVGIIRTKEFLIRLSEDKNFDIREILHPARFVPSNLKADILLRQMQSSKDHMAVIVDEYGGVLGLVTLEDLLEEIVGNIYDETDDEESEAIVKEDENTYIISADTDIDTVISELKLSQNFAQGYSTVAGYVFGKITSIPRDLTEITFESDGIRVEVTGCDERKILNVRLRILSGDGESEE